MEDSSKMSQAQQVRLAAFFASRELISNGYGSDSVPSFEARTEAALQIEEFLWRADEERILPRLFSAVEELLHQLSFSEYDTNAVAKAKDDVKVAMGFAEVLLPQKVGKKTRR